MKFFNFLKRKIRDFIGVNEVNRNLSQLGYFLEKFSDLSEGSSLAAFLSTAQYIEENMPMAKPVSSKFEVFDFCFSQELLLDSLICEFGVFEGETINYIAKNFKCDVFGFDSFEGLPEDWRYRFQRGTFKVNDQEFCYENNVKLVRGWFNEILPEFLLNHPGPVGFLHIDCDLYSSTKTVLDLLYNRLVPGTIIIFDEYFNYPNWKRHEYLAFLEFVKKNNLNYTYLCYNKFHEQVAVKLV